MKTLVALVLLYTGLAVAWFYSDEEFQTSDLPAIKRTAETLTTTLKGAAPTEPPPTPNIEPVTTASRVVRTIETGMGKRVDVTVEGFADSPAIFNTLVQTINEEEQMLGVSYPAPKLQMTKADQLQGGRCGYNQMSANSRYQGEPHSIANSAISIRVDSECDDTFGTIAHEVAHTWFSGNDPQNWIDEGLANSIEIQMQEANPGEGDNYPPLTYCATHRNIAELEAAKPIRDVSTQASGFTCNYTLGDGIFSALREHLGTETFNQAIAELGLKAVSPNYRANNVEDVKRVLGLDAWALEIIDTWYSGQPEMRIFRHLDLVDYTYPPTLDGQYLHFAGRIREPGLIHDFIIGKDNYCSQFYVDEGLAEPKSLAGANPLTVGWKYNEVPELSVINSDISPDAREFSITARVNDHQLLQAKNPSLQVASRANVGRDGECEQSTTFSQVMIEKGAIPADMKTVKHYHADQIAWDWPPQVSSYQIHLSGKAPPGSMSFHDRDNYCGQIDLYRMDESGYHRISGVNPMLPAGIQWDSTPGAEIVSGSVDSDGRFEAVIQVWDANLLNHSHVVLRIGAESLLDRSTNQCTSSEAMGAVSLTRK